MDRLVESSVIEFKREWNRSALNTVMAFANGMGGSLYIGIEDNGDPCGIDDTDGVQLKVVNALRDSVVPDIMGCISVAVEDVQGRAVVHVTVAPGPNRPYFLSSKGPTPAGTFVRQGPSTVSASFETIVRLMREDAPYAYEENESPFQDLTFDSARAHFERKGLALGQAQMETLGFFTASDTYTNLAWLLSDQCDVKTNCALFKGDTKLHFLDRRECTGSLLTQADDILSFLKRNNRLSSYVTEDWTSVETAGVPEVAYREAVLNLLVHQDYAAGVTGLVSVFDHSMEFVNAGGLMRTISESKLKLGCSKPRNRKLAEVFHRLGLIEAYGTGIPKMLEMYRNSTVKPDFVLVDDAFKTILPSMIGHMAPGSMPRTAGGDASPEEEGTMQTSAMPLRAACPGFEVAGDYRESSPYSVLAEHPTPTTSAEGPARRKYHVTDQGTYQIGGMTVTWREWRAVEYARDHDVVRRADLERELDMSQASIINLLRGLVQKGIFAKLGGGRSTAYRLAKTL